MQQWPAAVPRAAFWLLCPVCLAAVVEQWRYAHTTKMTTLWRGATTTVSVGGGRSAVGGGLGGRLVVAARVLGGGTNRGTKVLDGGGLTNGLGSRRIPSGYSEGSRRGRQLAANLTLLNMECSNLEYKNVALEALSRSHTAARHTHFLASIDIQQLHFCNR